MRRGSGKGVWHEGWGHPNYPRPFASPSTSAKDSAWTTPDRDEDPARFQIVVVNAQALRGC